MFPQDREVNFKIFFFSCPSSSRPTLVTDCYGMLTVRDSKPSRPNRNLAKVRRMMHMEMADMMMDMEVDKVDDRGIKDILYHTNTQIFKSSRICLFIL